SYVKYIKYFFTYIFFILFFFFFFQAEDGIRDFHVTGVQTCALPISRRRRQMLQYNIAVQHLPSPPRRGCRPGSGRTCRVKRKKRSEERRVGKECRHRWGKDHEKKKSKENGYERASAVEKKRK